MLGLSNFQYLFYKSNVFCSLVVILDISDDVTRIKNVKTIYKSGALTIGMIILTPTIFLRVCLVFKRLDVSASAG